MKNHIGCSSFYNQKWKKIYYPENLPSSKWFEYYCQDFDTFEINATFYKFPTIRVLENWYKKSPDHFIYSVKAPKEITHIHKFIDCENQIEKFYENCKVGLKEKLANILFQFPPSYDYSPEKLQNVINQLNLNFNNIIEFRHPSWWNDDVWDSFLKNKITFCSVSHPKLPKDLILNPNLVYIRLHGTPEMFYSFYITEELTSMKKILEQNNSDQVFVYFNNTASPAGIVNALEMQKLLL